MLILETAFVLKLIPPWTPKVSLSTCKKSRFEETPSCSHSVDASPSLPSAFLCSLRISLASHNNQLNSLFQSHGNATKAG